ncbi:hypothetical protein ACFVMC_07010 [Nocardia sp. NPDC127579]|uniref:hypothetical protein n=1 Tax=Nocardia sp. NPDC127579 TaxID=3345402 RepID=UPI0036344F2A
MIRIFGIWLGFLAFVAFIGDAIAVGFCFAVPAVILVIIGNAGRDNARRRRGAWSADFSGGSFDFGSSSGSGGYSDSGSSSSSSGCGGGSSSSGCGGGGGGCGGGS